MPDRMTTIHMLECCARPGGCLDCPEIMNTDGCDRRLLRDAAQLLRDAEAERARLIHALSRVDIDCAYCAHKDRHAKECIAAEADCERCKADCMCRECGGKHWTWNGGGETAERI